MSHTNKAKPSVRVLEELSKKFTAEQDGKRLRERVTEIRTLVENAPDVIGFSLLTGGEEDPMDDLKHTLSQVSDQLDSMRTYYPGFQEDISAMLRAVGDIARVMEPHAVIRAMQQPREMESQ
jgi:hypothetical protein